MVSGVRCVLLEGGWGCSPKAHRERQDCGGRASCLGGSVERLPSRVVDLDQSLTRRLRTVHGRVGGSG